MPLLAPVNALDPASSPASQRAVSKSWIVMSTKGLPSRPPRSPAWGGTRFRCEIRRSRTRRPRPASTSALAARKSGSKRRWNPTWRHDSGRCGRARAARPLSTSSDSGFSQKTCLPAAARPLDHRVRGAASGWRSRPRRARGRQGRRRRTRTRARRARAPAASASGRASCPTTSASARPARVSEVAARAGGRSRPVPRPPPPMGQNSSSRAGVPAPTIAGWRSP